MPYDFRTAMRGAVLKGGKPMQDFVEFLYSQDRAAAQRSGQADPEGFRSQHARARHALSQPHGLKAPALNWTTAGELICATARTMLHHKPELDPEGALQAVVKGVNGRTLALQLNNGGHLRLG